MIRVKKIAHAAYEMPDTDKQLEYYTEIVGLTVTGKDSDAVVRDIADILRHGMLRAEPVAAVVKAARPGTEIARLRPASSAKR